MKLFDFDLFAYLGKEYADGGGDGISVPLARYFLTQIVVAVEYLHSSDMIHRDLKPENIFLLADGRLVICDNDTVIDAPEEGETITIPTGKVAAGTTGYRGPEIEMRKKGPYKDHPQYQKGHDKSADIWGLGCILYSMVYAAPVNLTKGVLPGNWCPSWCGCRKECEHFKEMRDITKHLERRRPWRPDLDDATHDLMLNTMRFDPRERLTIEEVKAHPFFSGFPWPDEPNSPLPPLFKMVGVCGIKESDWQSFQSYCRVRKQRQSAAPILAPRVKARFNRLGMLHQQVTRKAAPHIKAPATRLRMLRHKAARKAAKKADVVPRFKCRAVRWDMLKKQGKVISDDDDSDSDDIYG